MLVYDTTPYMGSDTPERVHHKKLVSEGVFLILSCLLLAQISKGASLPFRLICAAVTAYNYHKLICLGCRKRTASRYANLLTLTLVILTTDNLCLWGATLIVGLLVLRHRVHQEYLAAAEKWNSASGMYAAAADTQPYHALYCNDECTGEGHGEWRSWPDEEEEDILWQEEDALLQEEQDCCFSSRDNSNDDSCGWGWADNPVTMDYAGTDWSSYDYASNPEVTATVLDMLC